MRHVLAASLLFLTIACGGAKPTAAVVPLTPEQRKAFDHGVDFVTTLEGLEGRWRDDWDRDLQVRVASSDLIAAVTVRTLRTDTDPTQKVTYRLVAHVDRELVGGQRDKEIELAVHEDQPGYLSVRENMTRIADKQYVAYVKLGALGEHDWHLSPASEQVLTETESKITQLLRAPKKDTGERVIVHTNFEVIVRLPQMLLTSVLLAACSRGEPPAPPVAPPAPVAKVAEPPKPSIDDTTFRLALVGAPEYVADKEASLELTLEARGGYHVNQDYPIRVDLSAPAGVKLTKASLGRPDSASFDEHQATFKVPFSASAGAHDLKAVVDFAVCTKETCVPDQRTVALAFQVR